MVQLSKEEKLENIRKRVIYLTRQRRCVNLEELSKELSRALKEIEEDEHIDSTSV